MSEPIDLAAIKERIATTKRQGWAAGHPITQLVADASKLLDEVERLRKELATWKPLTTEEAEAALAEFENVPPLSNEEVERIVEKVVLGLFCVAT